MQTPDQTFVLQQKLVRYCRTGEDEPQTTKSENTFQYRRLVYNLVKENLRKAYPLSLELFGKEKFELAVKHFFAEHKCQTAQVWKLPFEFYGFYSANPLPFEHDCSFVSELLLFEWMEIEVFMMEDEEIVPHTNERNENDILVSNPEIRIMPLQFPIHKKKIMKISEPDKGQYFVAIVRNPETKKVKFHDISYAMAEILVKINDQPTTLNDLIPLMEKYKSDKNEQANLLNELIGFSFKYRLILGFHKPETKNSKLETFPA